MDLAVGLPQSRLAFAVVTVLVTAPVLAVELEAPATEASTPAPGLSYVLSLDAALGGFITRGTNFGAGRFDLRNDEFVANTEWGEGYIKPGVSAEYDTQHTGTLYGGLSAVGSATRGDGDAAGYTHSGDGNAAIETAFLGWRSGALTDAWAEDALDLSYGAQEFAVGDGFLIQDGNLDQFSKGAYWLAPRHAFRRAGLVRFNTEPVRADIFYLESDRDHDDTAVAGINLEWQASGTAGLMFFHVVDSGEPNVFGPRDGMDVISVRLDEVSMDAIPNLSLWAEYVSEQGSGRDGRIDAAAGYLEGRYQFSGWPWSPSLSYRYARFSGDSNREDDTRKDFDPFFYGWSRGWGTWFQGEVTGEYLLFNSNQVNHMLHLSLQPSESLTVGAIAYRFSLDTNDYYGTPVSDRHFDDELDLYLDWSINDRWSISAAYGIAVPGTAAKEVFGDRSFQVAELAVYLSF